MFALYTGKTSLETNFEYFSHCGTAHRWKQLIFRIYNWQNTVDHNSQSPCLSAVVAIGAKCCWKQPRDMTWPRFEPGTFRDIIVNYGCPVLDFRLVHFPGFRYFDKEICRSWLKFQFCSAFKYGWKLFIIEKIVIGRSAKFFNSNFMGRDNSIN